MSTRRSLLYAGGAAAVASLLHSREAGALEPAGRVVGHPEAARAGESVLAAGGNAVDAIVTAAFVAAVVSLRNCGVGGYGGHAIVATPGGRVTAFDFNGTAPAAFRPDQYPLDERGSVRGNLNRHGWLASGVPGTPAGLELVLKRHGSRRLAEVLQPAIRLAREGFPLATADVTSIKAAAARFSQLPASARLFLPNGSPPKEGDLHRNPDLADLLEGFARDGTVESFYRGEIARKIAAEFKKHGGLVTEADLASFRAREVRALSINWNGCVVRTAPLTAGGLTVLQALHTLKALGWEQRAADDPTTRHALVEALRIAWHDRLALLGDPEQTSVPTRRLLSEEYAGESAKRVTAAVRERRPVIAHTDGRPAGGTVNLCAVDRSGMMAALTLTHGESYGAQVTVEELGLVLGHGMSRFDPRPDHPNAPGPRKRPLHNMCPTIVMRDRRPLAAIGGAGGRRIVNGVFAVTAELVGHGATLEAALAAPRLHTEGDLKLALDAKVPPADEAHLRAAGYQVSRGPAVGNISAVGR